MTDLPAPDNTVEAPRNGTIQEVVGESSYQDVLGEAFEENEGSDGKAEAWAVLVPEPNNRHDPGAVAVQIDGETVGYLPRIAAASIQHGLIRLEKQTGKSLCCRCEISGVDNLGVRLDMDLGGTAKWLSQGDFRSALKKPEGAACCSSTIGYILGIFLGLSVIVYAIKWAIGLARSLA